MNDRAICVPELQRSRGRAEVGFGPGGRLLRLAQSGSARAILPDPDQPEVVFLNTSGGLAGGDRLSYGLDVAAGVAATATTQTAERIYRSPDGTASSVDIGIRVGRGAHVDWLPQETILFDNARLARRTVIDLAQGAGCLMLESLVLGRQAMGETVRRVALTDIREVRREGRPLHFEPFALSDAALATGPAGLDGARALASLVLVAPDAAGRLAPLRALPPRDGCRMAASALPGRLAIRLMAAGGLPLRAVLCDLLPLLRRAPLPRVWQT
jgi:urease accessory protein